MKKIEFFFKETSYDFQILENEMIIAGYEDIKISIFHQLAVKVWLKEDIQIVLDIHPDSFIQKSKHSAK